MINAEIWLRNNPSDTFFSPLFYLPLILVDEALQGKWYDWEVIAQTKIINCLMRHVHSN
jgi:hypothetical protein